MYLGLHLCGPKGDGSRILLDRALALLQFDNECVVQAMLRSGRPVPDCMEELGLEYEDHCILDPNSDRQDFYGFRAMLERGKFSCGDAAGFEAAVLQVKHRIPARAMSRFGSDEGLWHAVYTTPAGVVNPVARFLSSQRQGGVAV
jgi:hypothetical protein